MNRATFAAVVILALAGAANAGQVTVGSGSSFDLGTGSLDLGCADLTVGGALTAGSVGFDQARNVSIASGGVLSGDSATLEVAGSWSNAGSFSAGTSTVQMVDGCGLSSATVSGNTTFAGLEMTTSSGFLYDFAAGSTQSVAGSLVLGGSDGNLLTLRSTSPGSAAFLDVQGSQSVDYVDAQDNQATGDPIILSENSVKGSNTPGWNFALMIPVLGVVGLTLLAGLLLGAGRRALP
jgi:hypothetical protein